MRDHIVQLPCDPDAFVLDREPGVLRLLPLELRRQGCQSLRLQAVRADEAPDEPGACKQRAHYDEVARLDREDADERECGPDESPGRGRVRACREGGDEDGQQRDLGVLHLAERVEPDE